MNECKEHNPQEKILLILMPFWVPFIPPMGISCLKSYLSQHGYDVKTYDLNLESGMWKISYSYFDTLKKYTQGEGEKTYGEDRTVLRNHLMAYINKQDEKEYIDVIKMLVSQHCHETINTQQTCELDEVVRTFYQKLESSLLKLIENESPTVLGISIYSGTLAPSLFGFKLIKERFPHIKTVMGGGIFAGQLSPGSPNFDMLIKKTPYVDKVIVGEGEILLLKLLQGKLPEGQKVYTLHDINGETLDLSSAYIPDFSDVDARKYPQMATYASRSCPFECSFCCETVMWGKYRKKSAEKVANELIELYEKYGNQLFLMGDSLLNPIASELSEELIKRGATIYWDGYLRADKHVCEMQNTALWKRGGLYRARLGLESGSQNVLNLMSKKITPSQIIQAVATLANQGIKTSTYWVIGHPGETEEDFEETLKIIEKMKNDIYEVKYNSFNYYPTGQVNSDQWAKEYGISELYTEKTLDLIINQTWILNSKPSRQEVAKRVTRFVQHFKNLGIPSPGTLKEIYEADERWKRLHNNAVPSMLEIKNKNIQVDENRGTL